MPRQNSLVASAWRRERPRRAVTFLSQQAASWPISLEPTSPGQLSPRVETHSADSTRKTQTGKLKSPAPAPAANPTIVRPSSVSALTAPSNRTNRMLKKSASFVLASFRPSTYPRGYASGPSPAAALLNELFEHPGWPSPVVPNVTTSQLLESPHSFPQAPNHVSY
jgi:hypothetical protein